MSVPDSSPSQGLSGPSINYIVYLLADITSHFMPPPQELLSCRPLGQLGLSVSVFFRYDLFPDPDALEIEAKSDHCPLQSLKASHQTRNKSQGHCINPGSLVARPDPWHLSCLRRSPFIDPLCLHCPLWCLHGSQNLFSLQTSVSLLGLL